MGPSDLIYLTCAQSAVQRTRNSASDNRALGHRPRLGEAEMPYPHDTRSGVFTTSRNPSRRRPCQQHTAPLARLSPMPESSLATSVAGVAAFLHDAIGVRSADVPRPLSRRADVMMATSIYIAFCGHQRGVGGASARQQRGQYAHPQRERGRINIFRHFRFSAIFAWSTYQHIVNI